MNDKPEPLTDRKLTPWKGFMAVFSAVFTIVFLIGALITFSMPNTYRGVARVRVPDVQAIELFRSDQAFKVVAQRLDLNRVLALRYGEDEPLPMDDTLDVLRRSVTLKRRWAGETPVVEIQAYSLKPQEAAQIANALAEVGAIQARGEGVGTTRVQVIDRAVAARKPARPNRVLNLMLSAVVGVFLGLMAGGVGARVAIGLGRDLPQPRQGTKGPRD